MSNIREALEKALNRATAELDEATQALHWARVRKEEAEREREDCRRALNALDRITE